MDIKSEDVVEIVAIITKKGKGLRTSKPKVDKAKPNTGRAAYVWRMVMFQISSIGAHQCMPVTADFNLCDEDWKERQDVCRFLDCVVKEIVDMVPPEKQHGVNRWRKALGY